MKTVLETRAEVAFRSLDGRDQQAVDRALRELSSVGPTGAADTRVRPRLKRLVTPGREVLYSYRATPGLYLVVSFRGDVSVVHDIAAHDRMAGLLSRVER